MKQYNANLSPADSDGSQIHHSTPCSPGPYITLDKSTFVHQNTTFCTPLHPCWIKHYARHEILICNSSISSQCIFYLFVFLNKSPSDIFMIFVALKKYLIKAGNVFVCFDSDVFPPSPRNPHPFYLTLFLTNTLLNYSILSFSWDCCKNQPWHKYLSSNFLTRNMSP